MIQCSKCHGNKQEMCKDSGSLINSPCSHCEGTGNEPQIYYINIIKRPDNYRIYPASILFSTKEEAESMEYNDFIKIKTIEVRI